ncbi:MAG: FlgD immunoglobulin-like domain containing protein [Candidatus Eisenbacteria bacterium]
MKLAQVLLTTCIVVAVASPPVTADLVPAATRLEDTPVSGSIYATQVERGIVTVRWVLDYPELADYLNVYRGTSRDGPYELLNEEPILCCTPGVYLDDTVWDGETFWYVLKGFLLGEPEDFMTAPTCVTTGGSLGFSLDFPSPNPARDEAMIQFSVPVEADDVTLVVYDLRGRVVRRLVSNDAEAGRQTRSWDCCDAGGHPVASGTYFVWFSVGEFSMTRKLAVVR